MEKYGEIVGVDIVQDILAYRSTVFCPYGAKVSSDQTRESQK
jgi:hypothetical protein